MKEHSGCYVFLLTTKTRRARSFIIFVLFVLFVSSCLRGEASVFQRALTFCLYNESGFFACPQPKDSASINITPKVIAESAILKAGQCQAS